MGWSIFSLSTAPIYVLFVLWPKCFYQLFHSQQSNVSWFELYILLVQCQYLHIPKGLFGHVESGCNSLHNRELKFPFHFIGCLINIMLFASRILLNTTFLSVRLVLPGTYVWDIYSDVHPSITIYLRSLFLTPHSILSLQFYIALLIWHLKLSINQF